MPGIDDDRGRHQYRFHRRGRGPGHLPGYAALPKAGKDTTFNAITGEFEVPSVNCATSPHSFSYHWVGLDGFADDTVEQDGVAADCTGAKGLTPYYYAWHEMYPGPFTPAFEVQPGDAVDAGVFYDPGSATYNLELTDRTSGQGFNITRSCYTGSTCENSSAEAITEGYYYNAQYAGTSNFGQEHYGAITVTDSDGTSGGLVNPAWTTDESIALGQYGDIDTQPGSLGQTVTRPVQSSFIVSWDRQN